MKGYLFISVFICASFGDSIESDRATKTTYFKENYIDPNDWSNDISYKAESYSEEKPLDFKFDQVEDHVCKTKNSAEKASGVYLVMRRFVNLLLKRAHLKDSEGNSVPLESISNPMYGELSMSLALAANPSELEILREFGQKKHNLSVRRVDELLTKLFTADPPPQPWSSYSISWSWDGMLDSFSEKMDIMTVLFVGTVLCILWSLMLTINGHGSWKMILLCIALSSTLWETSRILEEETLKQYSEKLRLGEIPDHCLGLDKQSWWQSLFGHKSAVQCYEYHLHKHGNPALKVSILKAALNQFKLFLDVIINSLRDLIAPFENEWFFVNFFNKALILTAVVAIASVYIVIKGGAIISLPFLLSIRGNTKSENSGSGVQPLTSEDSNEPEEPIKPPPRRRNGNKKKVNEFDCPDGRSLTQTIVYNITSQNLHFNAQNPTPGEVDYNCKKEKEETHNLDDKKEEVGCLLCGNDSITEKGESSLTTGEGNNLCTKEETGSSGKETEKTETEDLVGDNICDTKIQNCECDIMAGGDTLTASR